MIPRYLSAHIRLPADAGIQDVFRHIANDAGRIQVIANEVASAFEQGHKVLVLSERTDHLGAIEAMLADRVSTLFTLHGRMSQYAGRLHREHADKTRVRVIDFVDAGHPAPLRMWDKRRRGDQAMGYRIPSADTGAHLAWYQQLGLDPEVQVQNIE